MTSRDLYRKLFRFCPKRFQAKFTLWQGRRGGEEEGEEVEEELKALEVGRSPFSRASIDLDHWASSFNRARSKLENSTRASIIDSRVSIELDHPYLKILVHNCEWVNQVSCISHLWRIILNSGHLSLITVTNDLIFQYLYSQKLPYNLPNLKAWKAWKSLSIRHLELQSSSIKAWPTSIEFQSPSISHFGAQSIDRSIELKARPTSSR